MTTQYHFNIINILSAKSYNAVEKGGLLYNIIINDVLKRDQIFLKNWKL